MRDNKRFFSFFVLGLIALSLTLSFVAADTADDIKAGIEDVGSVGSALLGPLFGEKEILTRVFFAILIFMIIKTITDTMFEGRGAFVRTVIPIIVTCLSLLGLPSSFLEAIRVPYGAMGGAILTIIPFIIVLIFSLRVRSMLMARMVWLFFIVYYFGLYFYETAAVISTEGWTSPETIPFLMGIIAGILILIFMGSLRRWVFSGERAAIKESGINMIEEGKLLRKLKKSELTNVYGLKSDRL